MGINKLAIVTVAIGTEYKKVGEISHPTMRSYADKINADFIVIDENHMCDTDVYKNFPPYWAKFKLYDILKSYSRVIYFDTDVIIRDDCPNLFEEVKEEEVGLFNEGKFVDRRMLLIEGEKIYGIPINRDKEKLNYWNTGVIVLSKIHRCLFKPVSNFTSFSSDYGEQTFINLRILNDPQIKVFDLKYHFNRMTLMDKLLGEDRLSSYILHYAGCPNIPLLLGVMRNDLNTWMSDSPNYKYNTRIFIEVSGGLGDQVAAEPTIRYAKRVLYRDDLIYIQTPFPELFNHLKDEIIIVDKSTNVGDKAFSKFRTCPIEGEDDPLSIFLSHPLIHPIDFAALAVIRHSLPDCYKSITLEVTEAGRNEVIDITKTSDLSDTVLIHPGKGWATKTFPKEWWDSIINEISIRGKKIGIIGKYLNEDQGYVDVFCPENGYDFRDMFSLEGLIAAISMCPVLITNDSGPLHISGAFDNWLIFIPTCKHPDYLAPYRNNGNKYYKTIPLFKELTSKYVATAPTVMYGGSIDKIYNGNIVDYLPDPIIVIDTLESINYGLHH